MLRIVNGIQDFPRLLRLAALIAGLFRPVFHHSPIGSKNRIGFGVIDFRPKPGEIQQLGQIVDVVLRSILGREFVLSRPFGDAGLQSALDCIASDVISAGKPTCVK